MKKIQKANGIEGIRISSKIVLADGSNSVSVVDGSSRWRRRRRSISSNVTIDDWWRQPGLQSGEQKPLEQYIASDT